MVQFITDYFTVKFYNSSCYCPSKDLLSDQFKIALPQLTFNAAEEK
jgi:hypothetical protein